MDEFELLPEEQLLKSTEDFALVKKPNGWFVIYIIDPEEKNGRRPMGIQGKNEQKIKDEYEFQINM